MTHDDFWGLIDRARGGRDGVVAGLRRSLPRLSSSEIASFEAWFHAYHSALRREDLWAAIYTIRGGCSDDSFDYFRAWLIGQGEAAVRAAVRDPESLAELIVDGDGRAASAELLFDAANGAHRATYGIDLPAELPSVEVPEQASWPADRLAAGVKWTGALLKATYPRLYARYEEPRVRARPTGEIDHARFFALLDEAKARAGGRWEAATVDELRRVLRAGPQAELIGFDRWLRSYNQALVARNDLRALARVLFGSDSIDLFTSFRGWLIAEGEALLHATLRDPDSIAAAVAARPVQPLPSLIYVTLGLCFADPDDKAIIPGADAWRSDWPARAEPYSPAILRDRFPRVTAAMRDEALTGPYDAARLDGRERVARSEDLGRRAKEALALGETAVALGLLDEALRVANDGYALRETRVSLLALRARTRSQRGDGDGALADYDALLAIEPHAPPIRLERAKLLMARGRREEALAEAQRARGYGAPAVEAFIAEHSREAPPRRVRHPKFGDGTVAAIEGSGEQQTLTIDFADGRKKLRRRFVEVLE